jgi:hypothetical protein
MAAWPPLGLSTGLRLTVEAARLRPLIRLIVYHYCTRGDWELLFDLEADPKERVDLKRRELDVLERMRARLRAEITGP